MKKNNNIFKNKNNWYNPKFRYPEFSRGWPDWSDIIFSQNIRLDEDVKHVD